MTEWSLEERKLIIDHYLAGRSPEWIAGEMESTKGAIKMALSRWGIHRGPAASQEGPRASASRALGAGGDDTKDLAGYLQALSGRRPLRGGRPHPGIAEAAMTKDPRRRERPLILEIVVQTKSKKTEETSRHERRDDERRDR